MSQPELLAKLAKVFEELGIPYMVTGSHASSTYGQPRSTHDIDVVVQMRPDQVDQLAAHFSDEQFAFDDVAARQAIARTDMFQLDDFGGGDKIDFWMLKDTPFDRISFERRTIGKTSGVSVYLPTVEDHFLQKLKWAHQYEDEKQYNDALVIYEVQAKKMDMQYMLKWITAIGMQSTWEKLLSEAEPL